MEFIKRENRRIHIKLIITIASGRGYEERSREDETEENKRTLT